MSAGEGDEQRLSYHEGLTELRELKRTMLQTAWRYCLAGLIVVVCTVLIVAATQTRFWHLLQERFKGL
jgi:hypothetical protein